MQRIRLPERQGGEGVIGAQKLFRGSRIETVPDVTHREDTATFGAQLIAQATNVDVDRAGLQIGVLAGSPYRFEEGIPTQDAAVRHE